MMEYLAHMIGKAKGARLGRELTKTGAYLSAAPATRPCILAPLAETLLRKARESQSNMFRHATIGNNIFESKILASIPEGALGDDLATVLKLGGGALRDTSLFSGTVNTVKHLEAAKFVRRQQAKVLSESGINPNWHANWLQNPQNRDWSVTKADDILKEFQAAQGPQPLAARVANKKRSIYRQYGMQP